MIVAMARVRILGPRARLGDVLLTLQDLGTVHLAPPAPEAPALPVDLTARQSREIRQLERALGDTDQAIALLPPAVAASRPWPAADLARGARLAWTVRRAAERLAARDTGAREEQALIQKYQHFFSAFRALLESEKRWPNATAYHVLLKGADPAALARLRSSLAAVVGDAFQLFHQPLPSGETAVLIVIASSAAGRIEQLLAEAQVREIPVPAQFGGGSLTEAIPRMMARLGELPGELAAIERERAGLRRRHGESLARLRLALHDRLGALRAITLSSATPRAFVIDGWIPADARVSLESTLARAYGATVVVSEVAREDWMSAEAPVVLRNPRLLRPFETLISLMPLPRYGTIDPTPFVAVFFPAFFGIMVGDIGYGAALLALALLLRRHSAPATVRRNIAEIAGACAVFSILGGVVFGELLGDLGHRAFGLRPLWFARDQALIPFLLLSVALGVVHVLIGLVLGVVSNLRHPRAALGRAVSALMLLLIIVALLATAGALPRPFFTPVVIALLVAFPVLVVTEGFVAPIELLSSIGNMLSYARIMALGIASVMLAVVANDMAGNAGSVAVGLVFGLLFHLVNFAISLFSPTIHALRLHYVEFFGKFYSPGGVRYQPFGHWAGPAGLPLHHA